MNNSKFQPIRQQQIFDLTTTQLQKQLLRLCTYLTSHIDPSIKSQQLERLEQMRQSIEQQINERQLLSEFEKLCEKYDDKQQKQEGSGLTQDKKFMEQVQNFNTQFQKLVNQIAEKEKQNMKLSLPPEEVKDVSSTGQRRMTTGSIKGSKIQKAETDENEKVPQSLRHIQKQKQNDKEKDKQKQSKVIVKPKSINKTSKPLSSTSSAIATTKKEKQREPKLGTKTSIESDKISVVSESKPLKLVNAKKMNKKISKKEANDWLVQLVREEEEKRMREKEKSMTNRSSMIAQEKEKKQQQEKTEPDVGDDKLDKSLVVGIEQEKKVEIQPINSTQIQQSEKKLTQIKILAKETIFYQQKIEQSQKKIQKIEISEKKKQQRIDKIKQQIEAAKSQQKKQQAQQLISRPQSQRRSSRKIMISAEEKRVQEIQKLTQEQTYSRQIQVISNVQTIQTKNLQIQSQSVIQLPIQNQLQNQSMKHPFPIHSLSEYKPQTILPTPSFKILKIQQQSQSQQAEQEQRTTNYGSSSRIQKQIKVNKACYSEEYWERVRKEALTNLERVRLMKELRENEKEHLLNQMQIAELEKKKDEEVLYQSEQNIKEAENVQNMKQVQEISKQSTSLQTLNTQLPKPATTIKKNLPKKKPLLPAKKIQSIPFKLPEIIPNYLDLYPTFNHIFNVFYSKPQNQALLDIQTLMKEMISINSNHLTALTNNPTYKKPMFRAFDNSCMYVNDAHQLLLHAQTTNIDLKTLLNRLNIFNENLHGRFQQNAEETLYYRVVKSREEVYDIITTAFLRTTRWQELPHGMNLKTSWNLLWSWAKPQVDFNKLLVFQKVNHFPLNKNISRKDLLYKNLDNFKKITKTSIGFVPLTFNLPKEYSAFSAKFHEDQALEGSMNIWIMKPIGKSRGRGIRLINNLADLNYLDSIVVQKYLKNPLLLDGYKFDLRVYVLMTSLHPLEVFVYKEGFARLSTEKYVLDPHSIKNTFIHLTNFSIQRNNKEAQNVTDDGGSKITFKVLQQKLQQQNIKWSVVWQKIHDIIIKSLLACSLSMPVSPSAFELFGYDVIIDTDSNVHLIEINASPSLERSYLIDQIVKQSLIDDIMELVDFPNFDRQECVNVMQERLRRKMPSNAIEDNVDIGRMLKWKELRKIGEMPKKMGLFERVAPGERSVGLEAMVKARYNPNVRYADVWN